MAPTKVWFLLLDLDNKPMASPVEILVESHISDVRKKAKEVMSIALTGYDYPSLIVWQIKEPRLFADVGDEELEETLGKIDFANRKLATQPPSGRPVVKLGLRPNEMLLVQIPSRSDPDE